MVYYMYVQDFMVCIDCWQMGFLWGSLRRVLSVFSRRAIKGSMVIVELGRRRPILLLGQSVSPQPLLKFREKNKLPAVYGA